MKSSLRLGFSVTLSSITAFFLTASALQAGSPTTSVQTEFLMTLYATLEPAQVVDGTMVAVNVPTGWVEGPNIKGKIFPPAGDWGHILPSGVFRLDVRATIQTDDGDIIFVSYNGVWRRSKENDEQLSKGQTLRSDDCYFFSAPTFETKSQKYGWLNGVQAVGKMVEIKRGDHVTYDIYAVK